MLKTNAEMVRESVARKREWARAAGLCSTCCKEKPRPGRRICLPCNRAALHRQKRRRVKNREAVDLQHLISAHTRAGDNAIHEHAYAEAARHYRTALRGVQAGSERYLDILEQLTKALFLGNDPKSAKPLLEEVIALHLARPTGIRGAIRTLLRMPAQLEADARYDAGIRFSERAISLAREKHERDLYRLANMYMARDLIELGKHEESLPFFHEVGDIYGDDDVELRINYYMYKSNVASRFGRSAEVHECFKQLLELVKKEDDPHVVVAVFHNYGVAAQRIGDIHLAKSCFERALLIARDNNLIWVTIDTSLSYASALAALNQYDLAREYLLQALSYESHAARNELNLACIGVPIALRTNDQKTLDTIAKVSVIDLAFRDGVPGNITSVAATFIELFAARGEHVKVVELLRRALPYAKEFVIARDFLITVAQYGKGDELSEARAVLESGLNIQPDLARTLLLLFDAFVVKREGQWETARGLAAKAEQQFEKIHWYAYADLAHTFVAAKSKPRRRLTHLTPLSDLRDVLTERERIVAELILRNLTNREISKKLNIREHTVEKHVSSIMQRLDIRSRHQLGDILQHTGIRDAHVPQPAV